MTDQLDRAINVDDATAENVITHVIDDLVQAREALTDAITAHEARAHTAAALKPLVAQALRELLGAEADRLLSQEPTPHRETYSTYELRG